MTGKVAIVVVLLGVVCPVLGANRIREWGGHSTGDYRIETYASQDVGVRILANTQPLLPWKFEAYDSMTGAPGNIDYIYIDSATPVGAIKLNVIGQAPHVYGAQDLDLVDLVTSGAATNVIQTITIAGDAATDGDIQAYGATAITVGGDLGPYDLNINGPVSGDITIAGAGPHTGHITIADAASPYTGDIYLGGAMNGDLDFADSVSGTFEINGDINGLLTIAADAGSTLC